MRFAKTILPSTIVLMAIVLVAGKITHSDEARRIRREEMRETPGPFPSDWFMQQRTWPDANISTVDFLAARAAHERIPRNTLDEQPPWVPAGPTNIGGRVADIVGHPTNQNVFYVASASGGVFKTVSGGTAWTCVFGEEAGTSMGALAMDTAHPDTVYVGTGEACSAGYSYFGTGIYRTTDGGLSWQHRGLTDSRYIARIALDPTNPQKVWVAAMGELYITGGERGVYLSTDGGQTWEPSLFVNDSTGACDVVVHPTNPDTIFAATWQRIRSPEYRQAGGRGSGIYRTTDGGDTWQRLTDGLPPAGNDVGRIGLAISRSNPNVLYACYADHPGYFLGVFRSIDGGETWGRVNDGDLSEIYSNFGWYFGDIRVRPDNENMVFVLGVDLFRSTNGGQNWQQIGNNVHVDHHAMWFDPAQPTRILLGNDGGVYRSTSNGNSWTFLGGLPINQFYAATVDFQHPERRYGGTQDNGTLRTMTGALGDWDHIHGGDGFYVIVDPSNSNRIYAEYQWGWLERSENGGGSWRSIMDGIDENERTNWSTPVALSPSNWSTLYYGAQRVYRTTNRGDSWTAISPDLTDGGGSGNLSFGTITTIAVSPVNGQLIYAGTDDANVWVTTNGGGSWSNVSPGLPNRWISHVEPDPLNENVVYVTVSGYRNAEQDAHLFRSDHYGQGWQNISGGLPSGPLNDVIPDPDVAGRLYVASDFGTYVSPDLGQTWLVLGENLPRVPVIDLVLHNPSRQLVAATYGRSMFTLDLNRPPEIIAYSPTDLDTVLVEETVTFAVTAEDPDGDSLRYSWTRNGLPVGSDTSVELAFDESDVTEIVAVEVSDGELAVSQAWEFYVAPRSSVRETHTAAQHELLAAYPNPFNSQTEIRFFLPEAGEVEIAVYDIMGRSVASLLHERRSAGAGRLGYAPSDLPSGTYLLTL
ncbi:T9SS type A sorting domain-containing protein, partial [bacterium]|nr:T9SS type A sorting domain-containing protein [bacterium]